MRPIILLIILGIVLFSIRIDLTSGTIPSNQMEEPFNQQIHIEDNEEESLANSLNYQEVIVEPGQTVYGIVQQLHESQSFNVSLHDVLYDFEKLNPEVSAHYLIAGEAYKFPIYVMPSTE
ncbi:hypothetical protein CR194_01745 [Salipaludibacillus keqinensis]|uniref:LysM domain-containing protein n=1 Tax=Salipaludibacillus keqinensis TaxID=2045207 RepID=A0A323TXG0_9BACI|nr:hypothetical protein [Salipaludibacillus keqinensis]PYZ94285.1 hypothetical protein CR194_01745 [Salipaludibacillus keqinensis]